METGLMSPPPSDLSETSFDEDGFPGLNTLPMPRFTGDDSDSDSDSDREDAALGLVHERTVTASSISLDLQERLDAQQKANDDLRRKLSDAEDTLQRKLSEHEADLESMQQRIEELKVELSATKRQEKELRGKEVSTATIRSLWCISDEETANELNANLCSGSEYLATHEEPGELASGIHQLAVTVH